MNCYCNIDKGTGELIEFGYWSSIDKIGKRGNWLNVPFPVNMLKPIFDFNMKKWTETATKEEIMEANYGVSSDEELLKLLKKDKKKELSNKCRENIDNGFSINLMSIGICQFSYGQENQINFQDTQQLFLNDLITEVKWNCYDVDGNKQRITLDKETFKEIYLTGVKHKQDSLYRLNDVLIPFVDSAENKETIGRIYWDSDIDSPEINFKSKKTIDSHIKELDKQTKKLQEDSLNTMMALVQVSGMIGK